MGPATWSIHDAVCTTFELGPPFGATPVEVVVEERGANEEIEPSIDGLATAHGVHSRAVVGYCLPVKYGH